MGFSAPAFLSLLLLGVVIGLFHARRQRVKTVASVQLWKTIASSGSKAKSNWQLPKPSVALLLQLAILTTLVLALAGPFLSNGAKGEHWIVVVDASASMQAQDIQPTRFEMAKSRLAALLADTNEHALASFSLISAGTQPRLLAARIEHTSGGFEPYLAQMSPSAAPADWGAVATYAEALIRGGETTRIVLFTDGDSLGEAMLARLPAELTVYRFGTATLNAGVIASLREGEIGPGKVGQILSGEVLIAGIEKTTLTIEFTSTSNSDPLLWRTLEIVAPEGSTDEVKRVPFSVRLETPEAGILTARLPEDSAPFDDAVHFQFRTTPVPFKILYLGAGNSPLLKALQVIEGAELFEADGLPQSVEQFRLVVADDIVLPREPETNVLFVGGGRFANELAPEALVPAAPSWWDGEHHLTRGIDLGALTVSHAVRFPSDENWQPLLRAGEDTLLLVRDAEHGRHLRLAFAPANSNWPDLVDFPMFVGNLVNWLGPMPGLTLPQPCQVGLPCAVPAERRMQIIAGPTDQVQALDETESGAPAFVPDYPGIYRIGADGETIVVNAMSFEESADVSRAFDGSAEPSAPASVTDWTKALLICALVLLLVEAGWHLRRPTTATRRPNVISKIGQFAPCVVTAAVVLVTILDVDLPYWTEAINVIVVGAEGTVTQLGSGIVGSAAIGAVSVSSSPAVLSDLGGEISPEPDAVSGANVEAAIRLASAMLPAGEPSRVVLITPRRASIGNPSKVISELHARRVAVDVVMGDETPDAVAMLSVKSGGRIFAGDDIPLTALAFSAAPRSATLRIKHGAEVVTETPIDLQAGYNRIETSISDPTDSGETVTLILDVDDDIPENNGVRYTPRDKPAPRLLLMSPQLEQAQALADLLAVHQMDVTTVESRRAPWQLEEYLSYDAILLANAPAIDLDTRQQELIERAVSEHGRGLVIFGGENSFGPGGYLETPLERLSPLSSKVPREAPEVALAFVLDRSGSMSQKVSETTRLGIAKQATLSAIELLGEGSQVAVVVFDSQALVPVPLQSAAVNEGILLAMDTVDAGGGTAIVPGLVEGLRQLWGVEAPARHIVLMTDGLSTPGNVDAIMDAIVIEGITVSSVAIGNGADVTELRRIANIGRGSFHATTDFQALPGILSQEAMLLSGSPIEKGIAQPQWTDPRASELLSGPIIFPAIGGFVLATPKDKADIWLTVPDQEGEIMPLLASWRYGNGKVFAQTTHAAGGWTEQALTGSTYPRMLSQIVRNVLSPSRDHGLVIDLVRKRDEVTVYLVAQEPSGEPRAGAAVSAELTRSIDGTEVVEAVPLVEIAPGEFVGSFVASEPGTYSVLASTGEATDVGRLEISYGDVYSPEPDDFTHLALATGGRVLTSLDDFEMLRVGRWAQIPGMPFLGLIALALFIAELALRYLPMRSRRS
ncbi:VWA domain-containing protein [Devosia sp. WQ 349]|uniref:VWA domain-containing protein n=1 Tax=Devosia sp. WQ 349K1 TaxID=2800329 RepID=UPI00190432E6|nr:VWA domain-containing protein [Devosia sp. WQ 349K1]MBK1795514.1 VWA domain-containing protein [Devosia sp. WQ 349K1]